MNVRAFIAVLAVLTTACPAVSAQDHLEPEDGILNMDEDSWDYTKRLRTILLKDAEIYHLARMVCLPSFAPESVVTVGRDDDQLVYFVEYAESEKSLWGPGPFSDVKVKKSRASIDRKTAEAVQDVWRLMLRAVRYPDQDRNGSMVPPTVSREACPFRIRGGHSLKEVLSMDRSGVRPTVP